MASYTKEPCFQKSHWRRDEDGELSPTPEQIRDCCLAICRCYPRKPVQSCEPIRWNVPIFHLSHYQAVPYGEDEDNSGIVRPLECDL